MESTAPYPLTAARRTTLAESPDLESVFARYMDPVYRFLYRRLGNREDAEDLTSEVFLKAARALDHDRSEESVATWLFTVARTVLADHWRRYYRSPPPVELDDARTMGLVAEPESTPGSTDRSETMVRQVLVGLPDRYRQVIELRFLRGYSIGETAAELGLSSDNVKVIQHRALKKAADLVEETI